MFMAGMVRDFRQNGRLRHLFDPSACAFRVPDSAQIYVANR
jgi:hypothetical protein